MEQTKRRRALNYIVGALLFFFVVVGMISTVRFFTGKAQHLSIRERQLEQYRVLLRPVVMNDPSAFDDVTLANENELLSIAIWNILLQEPDPDKYEYAEGEMLLPKAEVEESLHTLFGADVAVSHGAVDGGGVSFGYSEKKGCYMIPITGVTPIYTPQIEDIELKNERILLTVGYLSGADFTQNEKGEIVTPEPAKRMLVTLRRGKDDRFFISALQDIYS
ncbi:MAG: hypothetical protein IKR49_03395 [Clostridia bacterium]|nr:hypothetical protein [Clostridia bacterium]